MATVDEKLEIQNAGCVRFVTAIDNDENVLGPACAYACTNVDDGVTR